MSGLEIDFESQSPVDLIKRGPYVYAQHPATKTLFASYKLHGGPLRRWKRGEPCPADIREHVESGGEIIAHNAAFERLMWQNDLTPRCGWPAVRLEQFRCTAVTAAAMSLPRSLDRLGAALNLPVQKDKAGKTLMRIHSIPIGFDASGEPIWHAKVDDPDSLEAYHRYCDDDVLTEEAANARLIPLSDEEMQVYWLNERINDRGLRIDTESAAAAVRMSDEAKRRINRELTIVTGGYVTAVTETAKMKAWIAAQGVEMPSMDKDDVDEFLHEVDDLPERVRRVLELRQEGAKPSVEKIAAMLARVCSDGRARGVYLHHGAGRTGRFSSRGVQAHNMPKYRKVFESEMEKGLRLDVLMRAIRTGDPNVVEVLYGPELGRPLHLLSDAVRSFIWAAPGHDLLDADYSSIEGRMAAWFAKEEWKVEAYRALDRGEGHGIYELAAAGIYGVPVETVAKAMRPTGKVAELSCLAGDTAVLTDKGVLPITSVTRAHKLWDGVEWVSHDGLVFRGRKQTLTMDGVRLTGDHLVLTGPTWRPARDIVSNQGCLARALATGSGALPWSVSKSALQAACSELLCSAIAALRLGACTSAICAEAPFHAAGPAHRKFAPRTASNITAMQTSSLMTRIVDVCSGASLLALTAARTRKTPAITTTVGEAYRSIGVETAEHFSRISSLLMGRINPISNLIESTFRRTTNRETFVSSLTPSTRQTSENPETCRPRSSVFAAKTSCCESVYDILNAGPRNRFTIFSTSGALIVHNCQYQTGVGGIRKFARQSKIKLHTLYGPLWDAASGDYRERVEDRFEDRVKANDPNCEALGREGWIAAELIKMGWRGKHPGIADRDTGAWTQLEQAAIAAVENPGSIQSALFGRVKYIVAHGFLWCRLPSGRCLAYRAPKMMKTEAPWADKTLEPEKREKKMSLTARGTDSITEKWIRFPLYGGSLFNNVVQGSARDVLVNGMLKAEAAGYPIVLHTHDEMAAEVPRGFGDVQAFERLICELPVWAEGLPLTAAGWRGKRYRKD